MTDHTDNTQSYRIAPNQPEQHCADCNAVLERTSGLTGRASKYCRSCRQRRPQSVRDTSTTTVIRNSRLLSQHW